VNTDKYKLFTVCSAEVTAVEKAPVKVLTLSSEDMEDHSSCNSCDQKFLYGVQYSTVLYCTVQCSTEKVCTECTMMPGCGAPSEPQFVMLEVQTVN